MWRLSTPKASIPVHQPYAKERTLSTTEIAIARCRL